MADNKRVAIDVHKLMTSQFKVHIENDNLDVLTVEFPGPSGTPYKGGIWQVRVEIPVNYPYSSPSVVFQTPIFHPNIDAQTGSVCLDVINQTWTPMFGLVNIFESFLPQLLAYPNASDPLNREAAILFHQSQQRYNSVIVKMTLKYATPKKEAPKEEPPQPSGRAETDSDMSSLEEFSDDD